MYRRILVPLDGSRVAEGVLPHVRKLAGSTSAEVVLVRVVEHVREGLGGRVVPAGAAHVSDQDLVRSAHKYLSHVKDTLEAQGTPAQVAVISGIGAAKTVVKYAQEREADIIALMSHGLGPAARGVFGSVAARLLELSPIPVFVVRATPEVMEQQLEQEEEELDESLLTRLGVDA